MKVVWRWLRTWWWTILIGVLVVGGLAVAILMPRGKNEDDGVELPPKFLDKARDQVERIHLEGEVEKARVRATAEAQSAELDRIEEQGKENPVAAREALSGWLNTNL